MSYWFIKSGQQSGQEDSGLDVTISPAAISSLWFAYVPIYSEREKSRDRERERERNQHATRNTFLHFHLSMLSMHALHPQLPTVLLETYGTLVNINKNTLPGG